MISYASDQGGVGPHFDSYDVFLLQAQGVRRWRIAQNTDPTLVKGAELKILARFKHEQEWDLEPGDMLYLPPSYAHEGVAQGECMTYSIGFKSPSGVALAQEVMACLADGGEGSRATSAFYTDPAQTATANSAEIPKALQNFAFENYQRLAQDERLFQRALGETLTEPKHHVWFQASMQGDHSVCKARLKQWVHHPGEAVLRLDRQTQMLYDDTQIFINAESVGVSGLEAKVLRRLANERVLLSTRFAPFLARSHQPLSATEGRKAARLEQRLEDLLALLAQWIEDGWLHLGE
jgi:50S ribosomal protein L16 3-hydroxylase